MGGGERVERGEIVGLGGGSRKVGRERERVSKTESGGGRGTGGWEQGGV